MIPPPPSMRIQHNILLSACGTFRIGGSVGTLITCGTPMELRAVRSGGSAAEAGKALLIGSGSNILFADEGWPGVLVRYVSDFVPPMWDAGGVFRISAAVPLDDFAAWACAQGWAGWENFSGIPGTLGGAVAGNAGAWGVDLARFVDKVLCVNASGEIGIRSATDCGFSYRHSALKDEGAWIAEVLLSPPVPGNPAALLAERNRILALRAEKHPDWRKTPCCGSFFKNLEPSSAAERRRAAGWFLEQAGAKTMRSGGAAVFPGHANILTKDSPDCTARDVRELATELRQRVFQRFGISLEAEVRFLDAQKGFTHPFLPTDHKYDA